MQSLFLVRAAFVGEASSLPLVRFRDSDMYSFSGAGLPLPASSSIRLLYELVCISITT